MCLKNDQNGNLVKNECWAGSSRQDLCTIGKWTELYKLFYGQCCIDASMMDSPFNTIVRIFLELLYCACIKQNVQTSSAKLFAPHTYLHSQTALCWEGPPKGSDQWHCFQMWAAALMCTYLVYTAVVRSSLNITIPIELHCILLLNIILHRTTIFALHCAVRILLCDC